MRIFDPIERGVNRLERWWDRTPPRPRGDRYRATLTATSITRSILQNARRILAGKTSQRGAKSDPAWYRAVVDKTGSNPRGIFQAQEVKGTFEAVLASVAGYLVGSVPLGLLVSKVAGVDIRRRGTGNIGAANVRENVGRFAAAVVALGIFLQGLVPPLVMRSRGSEAAAASAAVGAVAGYGWPVFLRFKGGRALGTGTGAAAAISPGGFVALLSSYVLGALTRQTSLGVVLGFLVYPAYVFYSTDSAPYRVASLLFPVIIAARRLEGVSRDLERGPFLRVVLNLLLFQRRPERPGP